MPADISKIKRRQVRANHPTCAYCGKEFHVHYLRHFTVDHITPVSQGGTSDIDNLLGCCRACNESKRDRTPQQWARDILAALDTMQARLAPDPEFVGVISDAPADPLPPAFSAALEAVRERKGIAAQTTVEASAVEV